MARKQRASKKASNARRTKSARPKVSPGTPPAKDPEAAAVRIRMYRLGVGDCFLVRLRKNDGSHFKMLIDCGVHMSQSRGSERIRTVAQNIFDETQGELDVVVATHEHWDHLSGFVQAESIFRQMQAEQIWCAWTEDEKDPARSDLKVKRQKALTALVSAKAQALVSGSTRVEQRLSSLLGFFGDGTGARLTEAAAALKALSKDIRYLSPGGAPIEIPGIAARVFVLGPPRDKELIKRDRPRTGPDTEVYPFGHFSAATEMLEFALDPDRPAFDDSVSVPLEASKSMPFFQSHYWADHGHLPNAQREDISQSWRRIDADWLDSATTLALDLDSDTNNTSLVLAIELSKPEMDGPVLLFAADAQVGNWLSWQNLKWTYHGRTITGPDLLRRTIVYKVAHHASHNATLRELGLEIMNALEIALVPTDAEMAAKVKWGTLPWPHLLDALEDKTKNRVLRSDQPAPTMRSRFHLVDHELYYEVCF